MASTESLSQFSNKNVVPVPITVARGDGIGPEIMDATLRILEAAGARLAIEEIEIGEKVYERGMSAGIEPSSWESLTRTKFSSKRRSQPHKVAALRASTLPCARPWVSTQMFAHA